MEKTLKEKRREVLREINKLLFKCDCKGGQGERDEHDNVIVTCDNCKEIHKLNSKLTALVNDRKLVIDDDDSEDEEKPKHRLNMTVKEYLKLRDVKKMADKEIAEQKKVSPSAISRFKQKHGLTAKRKAN